MNSFNDKNYTSKNFIATVEVFMKNVRKKRPKILSEVLGLRSILAFVFIISIVFSNINLVSVTAIETDGNTTIEGTVAASIIDISLPSKIIFSIDPNTNEFVSSMINIKNNSNAPVEVSMRKNSKNFTLTTDSEWRPENVLPSEKEWSKLNTTDSEKYLALGIRVQGNNWRRIDKTSPLYVKEQNSMLNDIVFGSINGKSSVDMGVVCSYGLAFSEEKECSYRVILSFKID